MLGTGCASNLGKSSVHVTRQIGWRHTLKSHVVNYKINVCACGFIMKCVVPMISFGCIECSIECYFIIHKN